MEDLKKYKDLLLKSRVELAECLNSLKDSSRPLDLATPIGRISRMDEMARQQLQLSNKKKMELKLKRVDSAIQRIDDGTYGECVRCEDEISHKRLNATPEALMCLNCQEGVE